MKGRWTQYDEDSARLPEGFKRIGYDAGTERYTFRDAKGMIYQGEPGSFYGVLTPVHSTNTMVDHTRPSASSSSPLVRRSTLPVGTESSSSPPPRTFQDILPPELITSSSMSCPPPNSLPKSTFRAGGQVVKAVRKSTLPKMQGVVHNLRRSVTSMRRPRSSSLNDTNSTYEDETNRLIRDDYSMSTSSLGKPSLVAGSRTPSRRSTLGANFTTNS